MVPMEGGISARGGADLLFLSTSAPLDLDGARAHKRVTLEQGDSLSFALHHRKSWEEPPTRGNEREVEKPPQPAGLPARNTNS
ncbi:MAG: hypothetical protein ABR529_14210 [Actinomycetota bacterium]